MAKATKSPGSILLDLLKKYDLNCNYLSKEIKCSQTALRLISLDKSRITTSIAVRLAKYFGTKPEFWLLAQMEYDLAKAEANKTLAKQLNAISKVGKPGTVRKVKAGRPAGKKNVKSKKK
ncbi:MAG: HigA family addiction module antidote protein [Treponema sp.]|jgi:addiction module HigA family antidote|nr:HigA family addiction module antidote protein [Treponema sp.]